MPFETKKWQKTVKKVPRFSNKKRQICQLSAFLGTFGGRAILKHIFNFWNKISGLPWNFQSPRCHFLLNCFALFLFFSIFFIILKWFFWIFFLISWTFWFFDFLNVFELFDFFKFLWTFFNFLTFSINFNSYEFLNSRKAIQHVLLVQGGQGQRGTFCFLESSCESSWPWGLFSFFLTFWIFWIFWPFSIFLNFFEFFWTF